MQAVENGQVQPEIVKDLLISKTGSTYHDQQMTFKNIPSYADHCRLDWYVPAERSFTVDGNGQAIVSLVEEDGTLKELALSNFENWPTAPGEHTHLITSTPCKEVLKFRLSLNPKEGDGQISLVQNSNTGWYVTYTVSC
ncbi:hypothetical protein EMPG_09605 [Blastomyces silverae]|uniref:Uncharacterized protein n=1 Tax=Blastomyces silverae TaxID=2060906 RepID=A0A0H1BMA4_9EURO|nr:hypothetical protein EMPG_09605 [Blastomyces silverae]